MIEANLPVVATLTANVPWATFNLVARSVSSANAPVGSAAWGSITGNISAQTDLQTQFATKANANVTINGSNLSANVTLTTANISDSANRRYVTDAQLVVLGNTSGINTGDQNLAPYALLAGTLAQFAATSSAQLAGVISDETGSGSLVFANTPTLVTPNLGTPSAVVLTNATGTAANLTAGAGIVLANTRYIAGHAFNGSQNVTITAADVGAASTGDLAAHTGNTSNPHAVTKAQVGLSDVDNTSDANKPVSTAQAAADAAVYAAAQSYANGLVTGLWDDRGSYDASTGNFPASGGSGSAGAVLKGDIWTVSVAGTLGGHAVTPGDTVRAIVDTPGQTDANWAIAENNIGYVPENFANKNAANGYAGLSGFNHVLTNTAGTVQSFITTAATAARVWTLPDSNGTVAMFADITKANVGLSSVTDDAQTKAAVMPNTLPTAGQVPIGNAGNTAYAPQSVSGDGTLAANGVLIVTKTNGTSFAASATTDTSNATNITAGTLASARGGAGTVNGVLKANGNGAVSAAVAGTDFAPATSGNAILFGNASGGFAGVVIGDNLTFNTSTGNLSATGGGGTQSIATVTSNVTYDITSSDRGKLIRMTGNSAANLALTSTTTAATFGDGFYFYLEHAGGGSTAANKELVFTPTTSTVDGQSSITDYPGALRLVRSNGTNWETELLRGGYVEVAYSDSPYSLKHPSGFTLAEAHVWAAGGSGGGGGGYGALNTRYGGGGGGGGKRNIRRFTTNDLALGSTTTCTVGAGATGGNGGSSNSAGSTGAVGANSTFGSLVTAYGGGGGLGGNSGNGGGGGGGGGGTSAGTTATNTNGSAVAGGSAFLAGAGASASSATDQGAGSGAGTNGAPTSGGSAWFGGGGGGGGGNGGGTVGAGGSSAFSAAGGAGGGALASDETERAGGAGGSTGVGTVTTSGGGGTAGAADGFAGGNGTSPTDPNLGGHGGGGGGSKSGGTGGAGGNGGVPGGGGGGGGGGTTGGAGGAGANGAIRFWYWP